jgi:polyhydroxybutyrate depolymerase
LFALALCGCQAPSGNPCPDPAGSAASVTFTHAGNTRSSELYLPSERPLGPLPLVLVLGEDLDLEALADREGFCLATPEPLDDHWNDGRAVGDYASHRDGVDDVGFLVALIDRLQQQVGVDTSRVYIVGVGEGGMMAHRLASERADRVVAIAAVGAALPVRVSVRSQPTDPVSVLAIHGTDADRVPWSGGLLRDDDARLAGEVLSVDDTLVHWVAANGCSGLVETRHGAVRRESWQGVQGCEVVLLAASPGAELDPADAAWRFFAGKTRGLEVARVR